MPPGHPPVRFGRVGVLLVNLGSPSGTDTASVRRYLREFLSDRRVIEVPRPIWWLILNLFVLTTRPPKTGPCLFDRLEQGAERGAADHHHARAGGEAFRPRWPATASWSTGRCATASRRSPSRLAALKEQGCDRILVAPLYPQYAAATTATVNDKAFAALATMRWQPAVRTLPPWHDDPVYIEALAESIETSLAGLPFEPEVVLASFHGLPRAYLDKGDPYHCQCQKTARLAAREARLAEGEAAHRLPVALRPRRMAAALYRRDHRRTGEAGHQAARRGHARLLRPTAWRRWRRSPSAAPRPSAQNGGAGIRRAPLPQRQRPRHARAGDRRPPRAFRLGRDR